MTNRSRAHGAVSTSGDVPAASKRTSVSFGGQIHRRKKRRVSGDGGGIAQTELASKQSMPPELPRMRRLLRIRRQLRLLIDFLELRRAATIALAPNGCVANNHDCVSRNPNIGPGVNVDVSVPGMPRTPALPTGVPGGLVVTR